MEFPPTATHDHEINSMVEALASTVDGRPVYLSAPITTGPRLLELYQRSGAAPSREEVAKVTAANLAAAEPLAEAIRARIEGTLIDPTAVGKIDDWSQGDYLVFWERVIDRFAAAVVFADGWPYSNGCSYEFLVAQRLGLEAFDEAWAPIDRSAGLGLIREAVERMRPVRLATGFLESVAGKLETLRSRSG